MGWNSRALISGETTFSFWRVLPKVALSPFVLGLGAGSMMMRPSAHCRARCPCCWRSLSSSAPPAINSPRLSLPLSCASTDSASSMTTSVPPSWSSTASTRSSHLTYPSVASSLRALSVSLNPSSSIILAISAKFCFMTCCYICCWDTTIACRSAPARSSPSSSSSTSRQKKYLSFMK